MRAFVLLSVAIVSSMPLLAFAQGELPEGDEPAAAPPEGAPAAEAPAAAPAEAPPAAPQRLDLQAALNALNERADGLQLKLAQLGDRVRLLRESVVLGAITPTRALIVHRDEVGASFSAESVAYRLDGAEVVTTKNAVVAASLDQRDFEVYNGPISPGPHELIVSMELSGSGFGLFTYLKGYRFKIESKYRFNAAEGRLTRVNAVAFTRKDITLEPKDRLAIRYEIEVLALSSESPSK